VVVPISDSPKPPQRRITLTMAVLGALIHVNLINYLCNSTVMLIIPSASARCCTHDAPAACRMAHGTASHSAVLGCAVNAARVAFVTAGAGKAEMVQVTPAI
jgi:hypothetical protein